MREHHRGVSGGLGWAGLSRIHRRSCNNCLRLENTKRTKNNNQFLHGRHKNVPIFFTTFPLVNHVIKKTSERVKALVLLMFHPKIRKLDHKKHANGANKVSHFRRKKNLFLAFFHKISKNVSRSAVRKNNLLVVLKQVVQCYRFVGFNRIKIYCLHNHIFIF
jgi:hypothetical protein